MEEVTFNNTCLNIVLCQHRMQLIQGRQKYSRGKTTVATTATITSTIIITKNDNFKCLCIVFIIFNIYLIINIINNSSRRFVVRRQLYFFLKHLYYNKTMFVCI